jgi:hypothetical protein
MDPDSTIEPRSAQPDFIIKPFTTSMIIKAMTYCNRILEKFLKNSKHYGNSNNKKAYIMAKKRSNLSKIYILKDIDWTMVPNCVLHDLIILCDDCVKNYKFSLPTKESLRYAANLIKKIGSSKLKAHEKEALHKMFRMPWTNKLFLAALEEFKTGMDKVLKKEFGINFKFFMNPYYETKEVIFLDFNIRHKNIMQIYNKLSKLRCKARKICNLPNTAYVGF